MIIFYIIIIKFYTLSFFGLLPVSVLATAEWSAQPIWHVFMPDALPAATQPWECTNSLIHTHTHSLTTANYLCPIYLYGMSWDCWGKPEQTHRHRENMQTPHRKASWLSRDSNQGPSCCEATVLPTEQPYISHSRISWDVFLIFKSKMTDFAVAFLKICGDICGISYCFAVKIYHGQHSSNIDITFLTSRTIIGLQTNIQTNIWGHQCH